MLLPSISILVAFNIAVLNAQAIGEANNLNHTVQPQTPVEKPGNNKYNMFYNCYFLYIYNYYY